MIMKGPQSVISAVEPQDPPPLYELVDWNNYRLSSDDKEEM